jgi:sulfate permease, SulP family
VRILAGLTGTVIVLSQGVAFALFAGLPLEYGLYSAIVPAIIAALFGSSWHLVSGPTTAISIVVFSALSVLAAVVLGKLVQLAVTTSGLAGAIQFMLGRRRLGGLAKFVSHTIMTGFITGVQF